MVVIRLVKFFDIFEVMRIECEFFCEVYLRGIFLMFFENNFEIFFVVEYNGKVVGYVMGYFRLDFEGYIMSIVVDKEYWGNGIGFVFLFEVIERFIKRGVCYIGLEVRVSNENVIRFYECFGFRKVKRIIGYYFDGEDVYYMLFLVEEWRGS